MMGVRMSGNRCECLKLGTRMCWKGNEGGAGMISVEMGGSGIVATGCRLEWVKLVHECAKRSMSGPKCVGVCEKLGAGA